MKKVFLGGTCNESTWREKLISLLNPSIVNYFNPVVPDWTHECQAEELKQRQNCEYCLYYITPKMLGVYSIAEVIDDSNKRPDKTIFCFSESDDKIEFSKAQLKSLQQVGKMVKLNGGNWLSSIEQVAAFLNK